MTTEMSIWIAKLLGPVVLAAAVPMVASPRHLHEIARSFLQDPALIYITGVLAMLGGLAIVNTHNVWVTAWPVIITLFGWALIIGGAVRIVLPSVVTAIGGAMMDKPALTRFFGAVWALLGAYLTYQGYF
jgi:hypothetical protein